MSQHLELFAALAKPFEADEVRVRPQGGRQLPYITARTVMNRLDALMAASDAASAAVKAAAAATLATQEAQAAFHNRMDGFLTQASEGAEPAQLAQEILEYLFEHQLTPPPPAPDLDACLAPLSTVSDESFEILNTLQFQDITRQKVEKVVLLLKQFKDGLNRLLTIFHIEGLEGMPVASEQEVFDHRIVATQERIFETTLEADGKKESVDDIIAQFKKQSS